jgi:hypothetical protein
MRTNNVHGANLHNGAANSPFLHRLPQAHAKKPKSKNGAGNAGLPEPCVFRIRVAREPRGFANLGNGAAGCYNRSVNESETITAAQPLCLVRSGGEADEFRALACGHPVAPHIERS